MEYLYRRVNHYKYSTLIPVSLIIIDCFFVLLLSNLFYYYTPFFNYFQEESFRLLSAVFAVCWIVAALFARVYQIENLVRPQEIIFRSAMAGVLYLLLLFLLVGYIMPVDKIGEAFLLYASLLAGLVSVKIILLKLAKYYRQLKFNRRNTIVVGSTPRGVELMRYLQSNNQLSQKLVGYFDGKRSESVPDQVSYLGSLEEVEVFCQVNQVHEIYFTLDGHLDYLQQLQNFADKHFIFLGVVPHIDGIDYRKPLDTHLLDDNRIPVITNRRLPLYRMVNVMVKRSFDIIFSSLALIGLSLTLFPIIAIAIKLDSPGPLLFKQLRPGRNNRLFWCFKFRTMRPNCDRNKQASKNDNRITRVGAFLRKTSLDELPQFYNVLRGDMSVVGPRPNLVVHLEEYSKIIENYPLRHWVTPGITGYAQVKGYRGETRETYQMAKRVEYDLLYMENWRLMLDIKIIWLTIYNIITGEENAY